MTDIDEAVKAIGFDVTDLAPDDFRRRGIVLNPSPRQREIPATARVWLTHSEVAVRYPNRDKIDRALARGAAGSWFSKHGTVKGLRLHRTFPCLGKYRVENETAQTGPVIVICDVCGDCFGVRRDEFEKALSMPPLS